MEKPSVISFLITLLLAAAVCSHGHEQVKDSAGEPLVTGQKYFIQPIKNKNNNGGGLVPAATTILPFCPLGVTQTLLPYQPGLPVSIAVAKSVPQTVVTTSTDVTIEFQSDVWPVCTEFSKFWAVDDKSKAIIIGGKKEDPNRLFKIEKAEGEGDYVYKLTSSKGPVGATPGVWLSAPQLVVTDNKDEVLKIKFKKVEDATTPTTSLSLADKLSLRMFPFY